MPPLNLPVPPNSNKHCLQCFDQLVWVWAFCRSVFHAKVTRRLCRHGGTHLQCSGWGKEIPIKDCVVHCPIHGPPNTVKLSFILARQPQSTMFPFSNKCTNTCHLLTKLLTDGLIAHSRQFQTENRAVVVQASNLPLRGCVTWVVYTLRICCILVNFNFWNLWWANITSVSSLQNLIEKFFHARHNAHLAEWLMWFLKTKLL